MGRAARANAKRMADGFNVTTGTETKIQLLNPVSDHFGPFIIGNAQHCDKVVTENSHKGQTCVIAGAGPSLTETAKEYCHKADVVIGCNSAMPWLLENGYKCTHGFTVDQQAVMINEWKTAPDVEYLVASTIHPNLVEFLKSKNRSLSFFHNFCGVKNGPVAFSICDDCGIMGDYSAEVCVDGYKGLLASLSDIKSKGCGGSKLSKMGMAYETMLYTFLYPSTIQAGSGLNAVTRAIDVAVFMGFEKIYVLGADCCVRMKAETPRHMVTGSPEHVKWLTENTVMHADGGHALASGATPLMLQATIDEETEDGTVRPGKGVRYESKIDLIISAVWLVQMQRAYKGRVELIGDGLPNALRNKTKEYLARLPKMVDGDGKTIDVSVSV